MLDLFQVMTQETPQTCFRSSMSAVEKQRTWARNQKDVNRNSLSSSKLWKWAWLLKPSLWLLDTAAFLDAAWSSRYVPIWPSRTCWVRIVSKRPVSWESTTDLKQSRPIAERIPFQCSLLVIFCILSFLLFVGYLLDIGSSDWISWWL